MVCCKRAVCCWNDAGRAAFPALPKKRCCGPALRTVDGAAARPLADKLALVGTTGRFPVIMRAFLNCAPLTGTALPLCVPNCPAPTVESARPMRGLWRLFTFENRIPLCSGLIPPKRLMFVMLTLVMLTAPKRPPQRPHHGWKPSQGPIGNQPKPPHPPKPPPKPKPPPQPKNDTYAGAHSGR